jgi:large subunit ribosomal protein L34
MEKFVKLKKLKGKRKHGFRKRMKTRGGRKTVKRRILRGRKRIALD